MNNNFYVGVVEDRHDPMAMGRVRVRVFGIHSDDRINEVPIDSLPWSMVMQPANASSTAGGISQLVEGTWVVVMYLDQNLQDPLVIGALPSTMGSQTPDYNKGFSDPFGVYPKWSDGSSDTTLAGKPDTYTEHPVYTERARTKIDSVPKAKRYKVSTVQADSPDEAYERSSWGELELRGGQESQYPYNAVHEYEGGMIEEFDSTPGNQRVTRMHPSGTYDEVIVDGTKTVKIVGDSYEIILKNKNIYVKGDVSMTIDGSLNQLVKGDYTLEVGGNYYEMIGGIRESKIVGNDVKEVGQDVSINIGADYYVRCGHDHTITAGNDRIDITAGNFTRQTGAGLNSTTLGSETRYIIGDYGRTCFLNSMEVTVGFHNIETRGPITLNTDTALTTISGLATSITSGTSITTLAGTTISNSASVSISDQASTVDIKGPAGIFLNTGI